MWSSLRYWTPLTVALLACSGEAPEEYEQVESDAGSTLVRIAPLSDVPGLELELLWEVSPQDWAEPNRVSIGGGRVLVTDPVTTSVHILDVASGARLVTFGRQGDGPGEWRRLVGGLLLNDTVMVSEAGFAGLRLHSVSGESIGRLEGGTPSLRLMQGPDGVVAGTLSTQPPRTFMIGTTPGLVEEVALSSQEDRYPLETYGSCSLLAPIRDGFARLTCSAGRLELLDEAGQPKMWTEWQGDPSLSSDLELDDYVARYFELRSGGRPMSLLIERQLAGVRQAASIRPVYSHLVTNTRTGQLLAVEQPFGDYGRTPAVLHFLDEEGKHLALQHTALFVRDVSLSGDTLALLVRDHETDLVWLQIQRIVGLNSPEA